MNHVRGGGGTFLELGGIPLVDVGINGFTSGYFNTGLPGHSLAAFKPFVAGVDSGVNNSGTFVPAFSA